MRDCGWPEGGDEPRSFRTLAALFLAFAVSSARLLAGIRRVLWPLPLSVAAVLVGSVRANRAADRLRPPLSVILALFRHARLRKTPGRMAASSARMLRGPNLAGRTPDPARGVVVV